MLTEQSRLANFTNETGVDGTVRYLRNVMELWLLQECVRVWESNLDGLLRAAASVPSPACVVDPDDPTFLPRRHAGPDRGRVSPHRPTGAG